MVRSLLFRVAAVVLVLSLRTGQVDAGVIPGYNSSSLSSGTVFGNATVGNGTAWLETRDSLNASKLAAGLGLDFDCLKINHGSAVAYSLTLGDGDSLSFDWQFLSDELSGRGVSRDDIAFWGLFDRAGNTRDFEVLTLTSAFQADFVASSQGFASETARVTLKPSTAAGDYLLVFGVANVGNNTQHSALSIQNLLVTSAPQPMASLPLSDLVVADPLIQQTIVNPEPASLVVWTLGMVGVAVGAMHRRRRATSASTSVA